MKVTLSKSKNCEQVYITKSFRNENGKSTSKIIKKLGSMESLLPKFENNREKVIEWAKNEANKMTQAEKEGTLSIPIEFSEGVQLEIGDNKTLDGGFLFLKNIYHDIGLDQICDDIQRKYNFKYDISKILEDLVYSRILAPSSKLSSYEYSQKFITKPTYSLHDIYRSLDILNKESEYIQSQIYANSKSLRNDSILYYDCTNFFFEIENESGLKQYGKGKEHRPNPIVQLGMFIDGNGMPLAFSIFPGNENEQPSLIPLEKRIMDDFKLSKFIICTDAGLAATANRRFNNKPGRSYIVTQSLKTMKGFLREWALDPKGWHLGSSKEEYNLNEINDEIYMNSVFHKERWINENNLEQRLIVSYSPKYKYYQREIRQRQINRAVNIINNGKSAKTRNLNSPDRFIEEIQLTMDGEIAENTKVFLNTDKIKDEEQYDGFTAVCTTLEDDIKEILKVNRQRWEIEESFRIMKTEFKARPVYVQTDEHIKAHFLTCFISLLIFRILEHKLDEKYTSAEIIKTLRSMKFLKIDHIGYIPEYTRTEITDSLHEKAGFRTDLQIISEKNMKKILKLVKE